MHAEIRTQVVYLVISSTNQSQISDAARDAEAPSPSHSHDAAILTIIKEAIIVSINFRLLERRRIYRVNMIMNNLKREGTSG